MTTPKTNAVEFDTSGLDVWTDPEHFEVAAERIAEYAATGLFEEIVPISSRLVVNQAALKLKRAQLQPLIDTFTRAVG